MYDDHSHQDVPPPAGEPPGDGSPIVPATEAIDHPAANCTGCTTESQPAAPDAPHAAQAELLGQLPAEMATLLIIAGAAGIVLPGPVGTPLLIAGCVMMWPKTFSPIEVWFSRRFPKIHREGVTQIKEFVFDLKQRFPDGK